MRARMSDDDWKIWIRIRNAYELMIKKDFGVDLTWGEKAALDHYLQSFSIEHKRQKETLGHSTIVADWCAYSKFIQDYFGFNVDELDRQTIRTWKDGKVKEVKYGLDLLGKDEFKELMVKKIGRLREDRDFI